MMNLFGEDVPTEEPVLPPRPLVVPRSAGWTFISNRQGPQGYHKIKTTGKLSSLVTVCGITGHRVIEHQRGIIECPLCNDLSA